MLSVPILATEKLNLKDKNINIIMISADIYYVAYYLKKT